MTQSFDTTTILIAAAAILLLAIVLFLLARTGRKPPVGPAETPAELSPVVPDEPLPDIAAAPAPAPAAAAAPVPLGPPDELTRLKGLGPRAAGLLGGLGVTRYDQIAAWTDADVERIDAEMGAFRGRIARDRWVEQARFLAAGDTAGFEERFGRLG